jgi:putative ABC transport system permease protein
VSRLAAWRPALRIARRDALRARGRTALIVAMIALPVLAMTAVDVLARSAQLDPAEKVQRRLGAAQASVEGGWGSGSVLQAPDPREGSIVLGDDQSPTTGDGPLEHAPPGWRAVTSQSTSVRVETSAGVAHSEWSETDIGDPAFDGKYDVRAGTAPNRPGEIAISVSLFERLGVELGGQLELAQPAGAYRIVGIVHQLGVHEADLIWALPGELIGTDRLAAQSVESATVYLAGDRPVTWADVQDLNQLGLMVTSRAVLLDPPDRSEVPYYDEYGDSSSTADMVWLVLALTVVVVLAGLEVCLLAGAAFAVGARRQARSLGLVAATGGSARDVRRVVLAGGAVLGAAAAMSGVLAGLLLAWVARPLLTNLADADFGHFDVRPLELLTIAVLGLVTGLLSAVLPARTAARQNPVVALTGRRGVVRTPKKVPAIGMALVVIGVAMAALGSTLAVAQSTGLNPTNGVQTGLVAGLIALGAAVAQIGLIITSPAIIGLAGRWSRRLPLAGRLALRDAARHRGRSAPAMAAVLTAVTGSVGLLLFVTSLDAHDREQYTEAWPAGHGGVQLASYHFDAETGTETVSHSDAERVLPALRAELPPFEPLVVRSTTGDAALPLEAPGKACFLWALVGEPTDAQFRRAERDPRCDTTETAFYGSSLSGTPVGGLATAELVAGRSLPAEAEAVLRAGGVVVFDDDYIDEAGRVRFDVGGEQSGGDAARAADVVAVPGAYVHATCPLSLLVLSEVAAQTLGTPTAETTLLLRFAELPTEAQEEAAREALAEAGTDLWFSVERGYRSGYGLGILALVLGAAVITLGAAGIATGLAQADARADQATLSAVGAPPRVRRTLAAAQALSIAGLGTALGIAAGFVPGVALIGAIESLELVVPWLELAGVLVGIPMLAGLSAWLLTRSRVPLERRMT